MRYEQPFEDYAAGGYAEPSDGSKRSQFFSAAHLALKPVPARQWLVDGLIPQKTVTLLSGDGGTGKSLLALQLAVAACTGGVWAGRYVEPGRALLISAEDDEDELHRRLDDILTFDHKAYEDIGGLVLRSLAGEDALLATDTALALTATKLFHELETRASGEDPQLIVIDTLADVYPANENDRAKVRQFVGILRGLALRQKCAVVLLGHPSLSGLSSGSGTSGSTAWNNSVRSRLDLERVTQDGHESNPDARILRTMKANYGRVGDEIAMTWRAGVFVVDATETSLDRMASTAKAERVFLKLLKQLGEQGRKVNHAGATTYAPKVFAEHPQSEGVTKRALRAAMEALIAAGRVTIETEGPPSKQRQYLRAKEGV